MSDQSTTVPAITARQQQAVDLHDQGMTNAQVGDAMGIKSGAAGNLITEGLRRLGRGDEIGGNGVGRPAGTGSPKVSTKVTLKEAAIALGVKPMLAGVVDDRERMVREVARIDDQIAQLTARLGEAQEALSAWDADFEDSLGVTYEAVVEKQAAMVAEAEAADDDDDES